RTTAYTSSAVPRFPNMRLSPRPFGSRSVIRLGVMDPELRPPLVAIPSVRDTAHHFPASSASRATLLAEHDGATSNALMPFPTPAPRCGTVRVCTRPHRRPAAVAVPRRHREACGSAPTPAGPDDGESRTSHRLPPL